MQTTYKIFTLGKKMGHPVDLGTTWRRKHLFQLLHFHSVKTEENVLINLSYP